MELFFLLRKGNNYPLELLQGIRKEFFDNDFLISEGEHYTLFVNKKTLASGCSHYCNDDGSVSGTGTFIYKMQDPDESLRLLLEDYICGRFDSASLLGHYYIFLMVQSGIKILTDATFLVKAYHDKEGSYLTSSFLLAARLQRRLTLNRAAATENLLTGGLIGSETPVNEINCLTKADFKIFSDIDFVIPRAVATERESGSEADAVRSQSALLDRYFRSCSKLATMKGADIGLTGGFDSRLVLAYAGKHFGDLQVHSHRRPAESEEWRIARMIAEGEKIPFVSPAITPLAEMDESMLQRVIASSFLFNDGAITLHCNWMEEYNTLEYRRMILGEKQFGLNGIGGEQYRNQDRIYVKPWLFSQWLKYSYLRKVSGRAVMNKETEQEILQRTGNKICDMLGLPHGIKWMDRLLLKRIQNEVLIPAYRGAKTDAENRHSWHLSPFADFHLSQPAYRLAGFLRDSKKFEADLIRMASPSLAAYPTDYGYNLIKGEPVFERVASSAFENLLPGSLKWRIRERIRSGMADGPVIRKLHTSDLLKSFVKNVSALDLPVSIPALLRREATAHMVISLGFLIEKLEIKKEG